MWEKSLLLLLLSLSAQAAKDRRTRKGKASLAGAQFPECLPPLLLNSTKDVTKGQQVTLRCSLAWKSRQNKSLEVAFDLFRNVTHLETKRTAGEAAMFSVSISTASELGPYKCKAQAVRKPNCTKYSPALNFTLVGHTRYPLCPQLLLPATLLPLLAVTLLLVLWIRPKWKARKAKKENAPRDCENAPKEAVIYTSVKKKHTGSAREAHYATSMLLDVAPGGPDGDPNVVYSELTW